MHPDHFDTEKDYQEIRNKVIRGANGLMNKQGIYFREVDAKALAIAKQWEDGENDYDRHHDATWSWSKGFRSYAKMHPKRFDLSIWYENVQLCGLQLESHPIMDQK